MGCRMTLITVLCDPNQGLFHLLAKVTSPSDRGWGDPGHVSPASVAENSCLQQQEGLWRWSFAGFRGRPGQCRGRVPVPRWGARSFGSGGGRTGRAGLRQEVTAKVWGRAAALGQFSRAPAGPAGRTGTAEPESNGENA